MRDMGINQAHKSRIQNVQTQKSPELPALGLIAQRESVYPSQTLTTGANLIQCCYTQKDCAATT